ncbi:MAG TPA: hypothetical protein VK524_12000, partial [Polyangiaceae bacterium]|nr:hypothetical protein [Polyangiaceae bacterium]
QNLIDREGEPASSNIGTVLTGAGMLSNLVFAAGLLVAGGLLALHWRKLNPVRERAAALTVLGLFILAMLLPPQLANVVNPGERFLICAAVILFSLPLSFPALRFMAAACCVGLLLTVIQLPSVDTARGTSSPPPLSATKVDACSGMNCFFAHRLYQFDKIRLRYEHTPVHEQDTRIVFYTSLLIPRRTPATPVSH